MAPYKRLSIIDVWHDRKILPGQNWANQIDENIDKADLVILLVSKSFINLDYFYEIELKKALKRIEISESIILPIILQHCAYMDV